MSIASWLLLVLKYAPIILADIPGIPAKIAAPLAQGIADAESSGQPGVSKKSTVMALAQDALTGAVAVDPSLSGKSTEILAAVSSGVDTVVSTVNALHAGGVVAASPIPPAA